MDHQPKTDPSPTLPPSSPAVSLPTTEPTPITNPIPSLAPKSSHRLILVAFALLTIILLPITVILAILFTRSPNFVSTPQSLNSDPSISQETSSTTPESSPENSLIHLTAKFQPKTLIQELEIADDQLPNSSIKLVLYQVGIITSPEFKDAKVLVSESFQQGPCKGPNCDTPHLVRWLQTDTELIHLPQNSYTDLTQELTRWQPQLESTLNRQLSTNPNLVVDSVTATKSWTGSQTDQKLQFSLEFWGEVDPALLTLYTTDPELGPIYTTKPELRYDSAFFVDSDPEVATLGAFGQVCPGNACFLNSAFFWPRPDGTMVMFTYQPEFQTTPYNDTLLIGNQSYRFTTRSSCSGDSIDDLAVLTPNALDPADLQLFATTSISLQLFSLKNSDHPLIQDFYSRYQKLNNNSEFSYEQTPELSPTEFVSKNPLLFWQDPFSRWVQLVNTELLPPSACEPIIYLYPVKPTQVALSLGNRVNLQGAIPDFTDSWKILANPSGLLTDLNSSQEYNYLFWEGEAGLISSPPTGYIVTPDQVDPLLRQVLPIMGLNQKETDDFLEAWLPKFVGSPYFKISFIDQHDIDAIFPLRVAPPPTTTIRILMDYQPLSTPYSIKPPDLPFTPPVRVGFTLVEWGGLKR